MAAITDRSVIGPEAKVLIDTTDRSTWVMDITVDVNPNTGDDTPLNHTDTKMIHIDRTTSGRIVWRTLSAASAYVTAWILALNDQREFVIHEEGTATGRPALTMNVILTGGSRNITRDSIQALETPYHANSIAYSTQS